MEKKYGVEFYSQDYGNQTRWFSTPDERDIWLINADIDNFYLVSKQNDS